MMWVSKVFATHLWCAARTHSCAMCCWTLITLVLLLCKTTTLFVFGRVIKSQINVQAR